jgi:hypothetical protein
MHDLETDLRVRRPAEPTHDLTQAKVFDRRVIDVCGISPTRGRIDEGRRVTYDGRCDVPETALGLDSRTGPQA